MKIEVIGSGCNTCKKLFELTKKAVSDIGLITQVEYVNDIGRIVAMGVMQSPIIVIDEKLVLVGATSDIEKLKKIIKENI